VRAQAALQIHEVSSNVFFVPAINGRSVGDAQRASANPAKIEIDFNFLTLNLCSRGQEVPLIAVYMAFSHHNTTEDRQS
jgi:hypothetical protein